MCIWTIRKQFNNMNEILYICFGSIYRLPSHVCLLPLYYNCFPVFSWAFVDVIVRQLDLQLPVQWEPITTNVVSSNAVHDEVHSIQHYVIMVVSDLRQVGGFLKGTPVSSNNKTDRNDIAGILLKAALNTISVNHPKLVFS